MLRSTPLYHWGSRDLHATLPTEVNDSIWEMQIFDTIRIILLLRFETPN